jgi:hypothetical protein
MSQYPLATELPPREELLELTRSLLTSSSLEQLTMKTLRININAHYKMELKPFSSQLSEIVQEVMNEPDVAEKLNNVESGRVRQREEQRATPSNSTSSSGAAAAAAVSREKKHLIELVVGDFCGDGHEKRRSVLIRSNLDANELGRRYIAAVASKKLPFDFEAEVAAKFNDGFVTKQQLQELRDAGVVWDCETDGAFDKDDRYFFDEELHYVSLWLAVMHFVCDGDFECEFVTPQSRGIGGFGLCCFGFSYRP